MTCQIFSVAYNYRNYYEKEKMREREIVL